MHASDYSMIYLSLFLHNSLIVMMQACNQPSTGSMKIIKQTQYSINEAIYHGVCGIKNKINVRKILQRSRNNLAAQTELKLMYVEQ